MSSFGYARGLAALIFLAAVQALQLNADVFLKDWSATPSSTTWALTAMATLKFASVAAHAVAYWLLLHGAHQASHDLHQALVRRTLAFPLTWFADNIAYCMTRLSRDFGSIDSDLAVDVKVALGWTLNGLTSIAALALASPAVLLFCLPGLLVFGHLSRIYVRASRDMRRMEGTHFAPVLERIGELQMAATCIRAFSRETYFLQSTLDRLTTSQRLTMARVSCTRWYLVHADVIMAVVSFLAAIGFLIMAATAPRPAMGDAERVGPWAALALNYVLVLAQTLNLTVLGLANVETNVQSVERVGEHLALPTEPSGGIERVPGWPSAGPIEVRNLSGAYTRSKDAGEEEWHWVLRDVSFTVPCGARVAILGRTGSSKSTLFAALLRALPHTTGSVFIDGVDMRDLSVHYLRRQLGYVNQEAVLLQGTLRYTLDPTGDVSDAELHALLAEFSAQLPFGLDTELERAGDLSQGQVQLIALLRSMVAARQKRAKIFLCDEPTSSMEYASDEQFWRVFRAIYAKESVTVITIAHRLRTLVDLGCDRVIVVDGGRVVESGHPHDLLLRPARQDSGDAGGGYFSRLISEAAAADAEAVRAYYLSE
ncbi:hypothetical protein H9P43_008554 [Blastocladiella emersonii ATCC 22665]|nr:hypothetical protein H9P43_008554 [Blastocladiella emersonii ATCC 22665]